MCNHAEASGGRFLTATSAEELREALTVTVGTSFRVVRQDVTVAEGALGGGDPIRISAGDYQVRIDSVPPLQLPVAVASEEHVTLQLKRERGKVFHRVVPNFVVQAGCPRGDGWGSTDYTIRSEFDPMNYGEGYMGMASAGKHTESCQWFITHSPAPHLEGRYTIFAKVTQGMDVVHRIEIGDQILGIDLLPSN